MTVWMKLWSADHRWRSAGDLGIKPAAKIVSDTEIMKNKPIHVFAKPASVIVTTGIISLLFTACTLGRGEFYERWVVRVFADRLWSCPRLPKFWETLRVTVHRLETGEVLVVRNWWRWTSYYHVFVSSDFTWAVRHRLSFCHISAYSRLSEAAEIMNTRVNLSR
jgi:hypothetical protein